MRFLDRLRQATRILLGKPPFRIRILNEVYKPLRIISLSISVPNDELEIHVQTEETE